MQDAITHKVQFEAAAVATVEQEKVIENSAAHLKETSDKIVEEKIDKKEKSEKAIEDKTLGDSEKLTEKNQERPKKAAKATRNRSKVKGYKKVSSEKLAANPSPKKDSESEENT